MSHLVFRSPVASPRGETDQIRISLAQPGSFLLCGGESLSKACVLSTCGVQRGLKLLEGYGNHRASDSGICTAVFGMRMARPNR